jgi:RNA methyltransferase, TrmH family
MSQIKPIPNSIVRLIRALQRPVQREKNRKFIVEGFRACREFSNGVLVLSESCLQTELGTSLFELCLSREQECYSCPDEDFKSLTLTENPQGCVMIVNEPEMIDIHSWQPKPTSTILILNAINDPGNAGTLLRTAWAFGVDLVIILKGSVDPYNAKTVRSAVGAHAHIKIISDIDSLVIFNRLKELGFLIIGASIKGDTNFSILAQPKLKALVLGSEAHGFTERFAFDYLVRIPMAESCESLNVAIAGAVMMWEINRKR